MNEIKKINVENVYSFLDFNWDNSLTKKDKNWTENIIELDKHNIFYWDNWNWKSTLTKILKKFNWDDIDLEKNWEPWNESKKQKVKIIDKNWLEYDLSSSDYNNGFLIFDKSYIQNNIWDIVFWWESSINNKIRWEKIIILWWFVEKEKILDKYSTIITDLEEKNKKLEENIKNWLIIINSKLLNDIKINEYFWEFDNINNKDKDYYIKKIEAKQKEIYSIDKIISSSEKIKELKKLDNINKLVFDKEKYENTFLEIFNSVDFNYEEWNIIKDILDKTTSNNLNKCLFCEQEIKNQWNYIDRIKKLIDHFSDKEKEISINLSELQNIIIYLRQDNKELEKINNENQLKFQKLLSCIWDTTLSYDDFKIEIDWNTDLFLKEIIEKIKEKNNIKSNRIEIDLSKLNDFITILNDNINNFLLNVWKINDKIDDVSNIDLRMIKADKEVFILELYELQNKLFIKNNYDVIKLFFTEYKHFSKNKDNIIKIKNSRDSFRKQVSEDFKIFAEEYWKSIWEVLKEINSSLNIEFEFKNWNRSVWYERWSGKYWFEIHYNNENIINNLSEWEKRSIALSYFFAEILNKIKIKNNLITERKTATWRKIGEIDTKLYNINSFFDKILVLDDPAVDFDIWHKKIIANFISKISAEFKQSFILSHDSLFINYLWNSFNNIKSQKKDFWIYKTKWVSNITEFNWDIFRKYLDDLIYFSNNEPTEIHELYITTYKLRFCIEKFIKDDLLWFWNNSIDWLITQHIWNISKIEIISPKATELSSIYNYCNNNWSHYTQSEWYNSLKKIVDDFISIYNLV